MCQAQKDYILFNILVLNLLKNRNPVFSEGRECNCSCVMHRSRPWSPTVGSVQLYYPWSFRDLNLPRFHHLKILEHVIIANGQVTMVKFPPDDNLAPTAPEAGPSRQSQSCHATKVR